MSLLEGKKVLLFAPKFFNYEIAITKEIECQGAEVHLYDERNRPTSIEKILLRKVNFVMRRKIDRYYKKISDENINFNPDFILFVNPEAVTKKSCLYLKSIFPKSKFILYMWDSLNNKNVKKILSLFDKKLSFDDVDCKKYGFIFRPLFFMDSFENSYKITKNQYDFSFIGSVHSDRARILSQLQLEFEEKHLSYYYYLYVPGKLMYFLRTIIDSNFRRLKKLGYVHIESISKEKIAEIADTSNYIIDINHPKQTGLTMRTIEMLGAHKKILTTNENIKKYDFYEPSNQIIIQRNKITLDQTVLNRDFTPISIDNYNKYRLSEWVKDIFQ